MIGNNYYQNFPRLAQQAINDAQAIGKEFSKLGFAVTIKTNLTRGDTFAVLNSFVQKIQETTLSKTRGLQGQGLIQVTKPKIVLFYYIGHGIQTRRGNYLIPVDAQIRNEGDLEIDGVNIKHLISKLVEYTSNINILMFDTSNSSALPPPPTR
ncbi:hypothetical protein TI05_17085 [Achromatium sp. WMS3]|nr:hypothetical protein TI05_17085 [Achromatium sp. WMS3]